MAYVGIACLVVGAVVALVGLVRTMRQQCPSELRRAGATFVAGIGIGAVGVAALIFGGASDPSGAVLGGLVLLVAVTHFVIMGVLMRAGKT